MKGGKKKGHAGAPETGDCSHIYGSYYTTKSVIDRYSVGET